MRGRRLAGTLGVCVLAALLAGVVAGVMRTRSEVPEDAPDRLSVGEVPATPVTAPPARVLAPTAEIAGNIESMAPHSGEAKQRAGGGRMVTAPDFHATVAREYQRLSEQARDGDVSAARLLERALRECRGKPLNEEHAANVLSDMRSQGLSPEQLRDTERSLAEDVEKCRHYSMDQIDGAREWMIIAAEAGDVGARSEYIRSGAPAPARDGTHPERLREHQGRVDRFIADGLRGGDYDVLLAAAWAYSMGNGVPRSPEQAYSYAYAYSRLTGRSGASTTNMVQRLLSRVPAGQEESARQFADDLIEQCCGSR